MTTSPVRAAAPAKLNLYLHVVGRRSDGYHLLDSLIAFADIHDTLIAEPADDLTLALSGPFGRRLEEHGGENLVLAAARTLARACDVRQGAELTLIKRLPPASGLGGGSADAAAALRALCRLWEVDPEPERLETIALDLGADVPVCLAGRAAGVGGIGESLTPVPPLPPAPIVLVNPGRPLSTPAVFKGRHGGFSAPAPVDGPIAGAEELAAALRARRNDLTAAAAALEPSIDDCLGALEAGSGCLLARMSGSGASCFGIYGDEAAARTAAAVIADKHRDWWVRAGTLVSDIRELTPDLSEG